MKRKAYLALLTVAIVFATVMLTRPKGHQGADADGTAPSVGAARTAPPLACTPAESRLYPSTGYGPAKLRATLGQFRCL